MTASCSAGGQAGRIGEGTALFRCNIGDLKFGILMVPLRGDAFKGQTERLALGGSKGRNVQVDGVGIRSGGLQNMDGDVFVAYSLAHVVLKKNADGGMSDSLIAAVGNG